MQNGCPRSNRTVARAFGRRRGLVAVAGLALLALPWRPPAAHARTALCVNTTGTNGCFTTVRDAVEAAPRTARIDIAPGKYVGAFLVGHGSNLTIRGSGAANTVLDGDGDPGVVVVEGGKLALSGVTVRNAHTGIGVSAKGRLVLEGVVLRSHKAMALRLMDGARLDADRVRFANSTDAISMRDARARIERARITSNRLCIFGHDNRIELIDSDVRKCASGLENHGGTTIVRRSKIVDNDDYGVVVSGDHGSGLIVDSTIARNGRGVASASVWANDARSLRVERSTIADGIGPGILSSAQKTEIVASTISGNTSGVVIDASFALEPPLTISATTVVGNTTGLQCIAGNCGSIAATIIANGTGPDCVGTFASRGFNLIEKGSCVLSPLSLTDIFDVDPAVGPLAENGGPTKTHALLPGSPAIGAAADGRICRQRDQRGERRGRPCAIGAYEPSPD